MKTIIVERSGTVSQTERALELIRKAGIKARKRSRSLSGNLIQVGDDDIDRVLQLLSEVNIRAVLRPD